MPAPLYLAARLSLGWNKPKITILGGELAGDVEATGSRVTKYKPGDLNRRPTRIVTSNRVANKVRWSSPLRNAAVLGEPRSPLAGVLQVRMRKLHLDPPPRTVSSISAVTGLPRMME